MYGEDDTKKDFKKLIIFMTLDMSDADVALLAKNKGIDIAVDLKGFTLQSRLGIFSYKFAPIQISYLGYPGTLGAKFIDYMIADKVVLQMITEIFIRKILYICNS